MDHNNRNSTAAAMPTERRKLPDSPFVPLAAALTWIAFNDALALDELHDQVEGHLPASTGSSEDHLQKNFSGTIDELPDTPGFGHFANRERGLETLSNAWRYLRAEVERRAIKVRGRYSSTCSLSDAHLADIEELNAGKLATFSQFDVWTGGIQRQPEGSPDVIWQYHSQSFSRAFEARGNDPRAAEGYLMVEVERDGLLATGSAPQNARAPSVKTGNAPSESAIIAKACEMRSRGMDGRTLAKEMRYEPGFENVATTEVRELIKGLWKPGERTKQTDG